MSNSHNIKLELRVEANANVTSIVRIYRSEHRGKHVRYGETRPVNSLCCVFFVLNSKTDGIVFLWAAISYLMIQHANC